MQETPTAAAAQQPPPSSSSSGGGGRAPCRWGLRRQRCGVATVVDKISTENYITQQTAEIEVTSLRTRERWLTITYP